MKFGFFSFFKLTFLSQSERLLVAVQWECSKEYEDTMRPAMWISLDSK